MRMSELVFWFGALPVFGLVCAIIFEYIRLGG